LAPDGLARIDGECHRRGMKNPLQRRHRNAVAVFAGLWLAAAAGAQQMYIYPDKGQSEKQQADDKGECQQWATTQTGFDPLTPPPSTATPPPRQGNAVRGAARGAAVGAVAGAIAGDAGKGAAIGAGVGGAGGAIRQRDTNVHAAEANQAQAESVDAQRAEHRRAMSACLEAQGYSVK
jgi:hypothetical protein